MATYSHVTIVDLFGIQAPLPIEVLVEIEDNARDQLRLIGKGGLDAILTTLGQGLEREIDSRNRGCRERWDGRGGSARIENRAVVVEVTIRVEKWICESFLRTRIGRETATVVAAFQPIISNEQIQVQLVRLEVRDLSEIAQLLNVEEYVRETIQDAIDQANADPALTALPVPLRDVGFQYETVELHQSPTNEAVVTIIGPNDPAALWGAVTRLSGQE